MTSSGSAPDVDDVDGVDAMDTSSVVDNDEGATDDEEDPHIDYLLKQINASMKLKRGINLPRPYHKIMVSRKRITYNGVKDGPNRAPTRRQVYAFLLHNGARPDYVVEWLHLTGRFGSEALNEVPTYLNDLKDGRQRSKTYQLCHFYGQPYLKEVDAVLPEKSRAYVDDAIHYARKNQTSRSGGKNGSQDDLECAEERKAYFVQNMFPMQDLFLLLHRHGSPVHLREISVGKANPIGRTRPVLDLTASGLSWRILKRYSSLHAGSAFDKTTQAECLGAGVHPLRTEMCLEIDDLPEALKGVSNELRWKWLRHAVDFTCRLLRHRYRLRHIFMFASGNKGPHMWLLDKSILKHTAAERERMFYEIDGSSMCALASQPTISASPRDAGWEAHRESCRRFYEDVLLAPVESGGFGLEAKQRSDREIMELTWPRFDRQVVCGARHTHRMPFSIHESTLRIAIPFADTASMPRSVTDMPHVTDPNLKQRLEAPIAALRASIVSLQSENLLLPLPGTSSSSSSATNNILSPIHTVAECVTAPWYIRNQEKKKKKNTDAKAEKKKDDKNYNVFLKGKLAPFRFDVGAVREWRDKLAPFAFAEGPLDDNTGFDADMEGLASKPLRDNKGWKGVKTRFQTECKSLDVLLRSGGASLSNVVYQKGDVEGRTQVENPEIGQDEFVKRLHKSTRHRITNHRLIELDISGAHPAVCWSALVAKHGAGEARRICSNLHLLVHDRDKAFDIVVREGTQSLTSEQAKTDTLAALNQSENDGYHKTRRPFLKKLVEERRHMEKALLAFSPLRTTTDAAVARVKNAGNEATLLSLLMQAGETRAIESAVAPLNELGFDVVAIVADAIFLDRRPDCAATADEAREALVESARALRIELKVKVDHDECAPVSA